MIIPIVDEATVIPAANLVGYPLFSISGMRTAPIDAISEAEDPDIPPKIILAKTLTSPSPPRNRPTNRRLKSIRRAVIPLLFMRRPIRINKGSAIKT